MTVHLPGWHNVFLKGITFLHTWSHFQRLRPCAPFPVPWLMPTSVEWDASCLASLSSNSSLLGLLFQHWSNQVIPLPGWWLESFCICHSLLKDRDQMINYIFYLFVASSPTSSHYSPAASSLTKWAHLCISLSLCVAGADTGTIWCFGSTTVPVSGVGVAPVPIIFPSNPEAFFSLRGTVQSWAWLSRPGSGCSMVLWVLHLWNFQGGSIVSPNI